jgi:hypothetical protein
VRDGAMSDDNKHSRRTNTLETKTGKLRTILLRYGQQLILKKFHHDPTRYLSSHENYLLVR